MVAKRGFQCKSCISSFVLLIQRPLYLGVPILDSLPLTIRMYTTAFSVSNELV